MDRHVSDWLQWISDAFFVKKKASRFMLKLFTGHLTSRRWMTTVLSSTRSTSCCACPWMSLWSTCPRSWTNRCDHTSCCVSIACASTPLWQSTATLHTPRWVEFSWWTRSMLVRTNVHRFCVCVLALLFSHSFVILHRRVERLWCVCFSFVCYRLDPVKSSQSDHTQYLVMYWKVI